MNKSYVYATLSILLIFIATGCTATSKQKRTAVAQLIPSQSTLVGEMNTVDKYYKKFNQAKTIEEAGEALIGVRIGVVNARMFLTKTRYIPETETAAYQADLDRMLAIIKHSLILIGENKLEEAKIYAKALADIRSQIHPLYR